jgi:ABC-2 type transport system permease protein
VNVGGTTVSGAFAYAAAIGAVGLLFAALTLVAAQLFSTSRGVSGAMFTVLGVFYAMRISGDMNGNALSYLSPLGLALKTRPFYDDAVVPMAALMIEAAVAAALAFAVCSRRDSGEGVLPARKGRTHASPLLRGEFGLAVRLTRGSFLAWGASMLVIGAVFGSIVGTIGDFAANNAVISQMLEAAGAASITDSYTAMVFSLGALIAAIPILLTIFKLRGEEKRGRLEQVLAKSVSRQEAFGAYIALAVIQSAVFLLFIALGYSVSAPNQDAAILLQAAFVYLPALWLMLGLSAALVGLAPKLAGLAWVVFAYSFVMFYFRKLFDLPEWVFKLSPFGNVPQIPAQERSTLPLVLLLAIAAGLTALGIAGFKRRDVG